MSNAKHVGPAVLILGTLTLMAVYVGAEVGVTQLLDGKQLAWPAKPLLTSWLSAALVLLLTVLFERRSAGSSLVGAARALGLGAPPRFALAIAVIAFLPILLGDTAYFLRTGSRLQFEQHLFFVVLTFVLRAGLVEETIFRGFLFRRLRDSMPFWRAAIISGAVFGAIHLANFLNGFSLKQCVEVGISVSYGFAVTIPATYFYEKCGKNLWGFLLVHVAIDSLNFIKDYDATFEKAHLISTFIAVGVSVALVRYVYSSAGGDGPAQQSAESLVLPADR